MDCERLKRWFRRSLLLLVAVPVLWILTVGLLPTDWARQRVMAALEESTGGTVRLDSLSLGLLGSIKLEGLELARRGEESQPWLMIHRVKLVLSLARLLDGDLEPTRIDVSRAILRAERGPGESFAFSTLLGSRARSSTSPFDPAIRSTDEARPVALHIRDSRLELADAVSGCRLNLVAVNGRGSWCDDRTEIEQFTGAVSGGTFAFDGAYDRSGPLPVFESQLVLRQVRMTRGMDLLAYLAPILAGSREELEGRVDLDLYLRGEGATPEDLQDSLVGHGSLRMDPVSLQSSPVWSELVEALHLRTGREIGTFESNFGIAKRRILSDDMRIEVGGLPIVMSGTTDFRGLLDYRVRSDAVVRAVSASLGDLPWGIDDMLELRLRGTPGQLLITVGGQPLRGENGESLTDRDRMREIGRRLLDRMVR